MASDKTVCPESTVESANRRNFVRKVAVLSAAAGVGSTLLAKSIVPESSASSAVYQYCTLYVKDKIGIGTCSASASLCVANGNISANDSTGTVILGSTCKGIGVLGEAKGSCGTGVYGSAKCQAGVYGTANKHGVQGYSAAACGIGVRGCGSGTGVYGCSSSGKGVLGRGSKAGIEGQASGPCSIPFVALGASGQSAPLQEWQTFCCMTPQVLSVVNKSGWLGIGTSCPGSSLDVVGNASISGSLKAGCSTIAGLTVSASADAVQIVCCKPIGQGALCVTNTSCRASVSCCGPGTDAVGLYSLIPPYKPACFCGRCGCCPGPYYPPPAPGGTAVFGVYAKPVSTKRKITTLPGYGVVGLAYCGVSVLGLSGCEGVVPVVAQGSSSQSANLQQWQRTTCTTNSKPPDVLSVVNKCGWLGLGRACAPTTLAVGGSVSANVVTPSCTTYPMKSTDFAVLANGNVTLPAASTAKGMIVFIKNISSSSVTVSAKGSDKIETKSSESLKKKFSSLTLISDGNSPGNWYILSNAT
jgi:hypothetical protein